MARSHRSGSLFVLSLSALVCVSAAGGRLAAQDDGAGTQARARRSPSVVGIYPKSSSAGFPIRITTDRAAFKPNDAQAGIVAGLSGVETPDTLAFVGGVPATILRVFSDTEAELLLPAVKPGSRAVTVQVGKLRPGKAMNVKIKRPQTRFVLLNFSEGRVSVIGDSLVGDEPSRLTEKEQRRIAFHAINEQGDVFFAGWKVHPTMGREEVFEDPKEQPREPLHGEAPRKEGLFFIKVPNAGEAFRLNFFDLKPGEDIPLPRAQARSDRRFLGQVVVGDVGARLNAGPQGHGGVETTGSTGVLVNGSSAEKYDIVFVGDGFTSSEQTTFNARVTDAVTALQGFGGFAERMCGFNIWRVNVVSAQSGVDHPADGIFKNTALDVRYGNPAAGEAERCITSSSPAKCVEAAGHAPAADAVFVLANDTQWGGCAGSLVFSSISPGFAGIITHELGHKVSSLADEYECYICDGSDSGQTYAGPEPTAANLTKATTCATSKWASLIAGGTPCPTTVDSPPGVVGLWQGGGYKAAGIYRPQRRCHMRSTGDPFCAVCRAETVRILGARCTACEIDPTSIACLLSRIGPIILMDPRYRIFKYPWPVCLTCPPDLRLDDRIRLILDGPLEGAQVDILNEVGQKVGKQIGQAQGRASQKVIEWDANRARSYFIQISFLDNTAPRGKIRTRFFRNGHEYRAK